MYPAVANISAFDELLKELRRIFKDDDVNIELVTAVMSSYHSNKTDWEIYAKFNKGSYTRNLVDENSGKYNLMVLAWDLDQGTVIHDHSNSHCFMKVLSGSIQEVRYNWPDNEKQKMEPKELLTHEVNDVTYINDSIGLHKIKNNSSTEQAVTLHLYSPPYEMCSTFDEVTGNRKDAKVHFWSLFGKEIPTFEGVQSEVQLFSVHANCCQFPVIGRK